MAKKILIVLTRLPEPPFTGRKQVILSLLKSLDELNLPYDICLFGEKNTNNFDNKIIFHIKPLSRLSIINSVLKSIFSGSSVSVRLFSDAVPKFFECVKIERYSFLVCDSIRLIDIALASKLPFHLDFDDRMSKRYNSIAARKEVSLNALLGYTNINFPAFFNSFCSAFLRYFLVREASILGKEEVFYSSFARSCSFVSVEESNLFSELSSCRVFHIPMGFSFPESIYKAYRSWPIRLVFVGPLNYYPNFESMVSLNNHLENGSHDYSIDHIGLIPETHRKAFKNIRTLGYVDDLYRTLQGYDFFIAWILTGTGIKTKVIEAAFLKVPIIASRLAIEGTGLIHKQHCYIIDSLLQLDEAVEYLSDSTISAEMSKKAFDLVNLNFSQDVVMGKWKAVFQGEL